MKDTKAINIGNYKPKRKFISFISATNRGSNVRLNREVAYVDGSKLSGMLEGTKFKITICDEGTINFEEIDTQKSDISMIGRLIDDIDNYDVTGYTEKFVIDLDFKDENGTKCYLEVEHLRPMDKLKSMDKNKVVPTTNGLNMLDKFFSNIKISETQLVDEKIVEVVEINEVDIEKKISTSFIEENFIKMNEIKVNELKSRIEDIQTEKSKYNNNIKLAENKISQLDKDLSTLETRLETMLPICEPNGYVFYVSHLNESDVNVDESSKSIVDKIASLIGVKKDILSKHLTEGHYNIKLAKLDDIKNYIVNDDVTKLLSKLNGKLVNKDDHFEYRGELNWHQIIDKMIRVGFSQDHEFDKLCGSISYESEFGGGSPN